MPSTICNACGIVFQEGKKYCRACGAPLRLKYALLPYAVASCNACLVQYVVEQRECALCGQLLSRPVEQVVGAGAAVAAEAPAASPVLPPDALHTSVDPSGTAPKAGLSLEAFAQPFQPVARRLARAGSEPPPRVGWTLVLFLVVALAIGGVLGGMVLVKQFRAQPEVPPPRLALLESTTRPRSTGAKKAETYNARGAKLAEAGNTEGAIAEFRRAIAVDPKNATAHNNLGVLYQKKGLLPQAVTAYRAASKANPDHPVPYKNMAILNEERSELNEALRNYDRYLELAPTASDSETIRLKIRDLRGKLDTKPAG